MTTIYRAFVLAVLVALSACGGGDPEPTCQSKLVGSFSSACAVSISVEHAATLEVSAEATIGSHASGVFDRTSLLSINGDGYGFTESEGTTPGKTRIIIKHSMQVQPGTTSIGLSSYVHIEDTGSEVSDISITVILR